MRTRLGLFLMVFVTPLMAAEDLRGRLLEKVTCTADQTQTYALYVPSYYSAEKTWPVIYCFDPGARGRTPVERLQGAAEKYGFIVAGSNVSRNGPWEDNVKAIQAMTRDVGARFGIDPRRIYSAGLSGGARVAVQLALDGYAKGVIACSAGFPGDIPMRVTFPVFGTAGIQDMNYRELVLLDRALEDRKAPHRVVIFDGGHEWASAALLTEAVEWLEVRGMSTGTWAKEKALVEEMWQKRLASLPKASGLERWRELKSLAADFKGLADTAAVEVEAKSLGAAREIKEALKKETALRAQEDKMGFQVMDMTHASLAAKEKFAAELRARADAAEDSDERQMARRVIASFQAWVRESLRGLLAENNGAEAAEMLELAAALRPEQTRTLVDLARARATARDSKRALEALRRAAKAGFSNAPRMEDEPAFAKLKADPAFIEILAAVRLNPPEPLGRGGEFGGRGFGRAGL